MQPDGPVPMPVPLPVKCGAVGCPMPASFIVGCDGAGCSKQVHNACHERVVLEKHKVEQLIDPVTSQPKCVCSKTCYNKVKKLLIDQPMRNLWDKDGEDGPDDPNNSLSILLSWLLQEGNYSRYRGGKNNNGTRKLAFGTQLANMMKEAGCHYFRTGEAVVKKIFEIESKFINAHDWAGNTGQGVKETDGPEKFESLWHLASLTILVIRIIKKETFVQC